MRGQAADRLPETETEESGRSLLSERPERKGNGRAVVSKEGKGEKH